MKLFQVPMKVIRMNAPIIGRTMGRAMMKNMRTSPAPSMRAASSISPGTPLTMACLKRNITEGGREAREDQPGVGVEQPEPVDAIGSPARSSGRRG